MERTNAGYRIIKEEFYTVENDAMFGYCLGKKDDTGHFVTWLITIRADNEVTFYHGNYFASENRYINARKALRDYHKRLFEVYDSLMDLDYICAY